MRKPKAARTLPCSRAERPDRSCRSRTSTIRAGLRSRSGRYTTTASSGSSPAAMPTRGTATATSATTTRLTSRPRTTKLAWLRDSSPSSPTAPTSSTAWSSSSSSPASRHGVRESDDQSEAGPHHENERDSDESDYSCGNPRHGCGARRYRLDKDSCDNGGSVLSRPIVIRVAAQRPPRREGRAGGAGLRHLPYRQREGSRRKTGEGRPARAYAGQRQERLDRSEGPGGVRRQERLFPLPVEDAESIPRYRASVSALRRQRMEGLRLSQARSGGAGRQAARDLRGPHDGHDRRWQGTGIFPA